MPAEKATALILRAIDFSESSCVVTLFSREFGKLRGLAKGGRRPKGPFEAALDLLSLCRIVFLRKSSDALDLLTEAKLLRRFRPAGGNLANLYAAYYVVELLDQMTDDYDPHPQLFDLADTVLEALGSGYDVGRWTLRFEMGMLRLLGHAPLLDRCVECGVPVDAASVDATPRVAFGVLDGGTLCTKCRHGKKHVITVTAGTIDLLRTFSAPADEWRSTEFEEVNQGELRAVVNRYLTHLIGHKLRMHDYLGAVLN